MEDMEDESSSVKADLSPRTRESHYPPAPRWWHCRLSIVTACFARLVEPGLAVQSLSIKSPE